MERFSLFVGYPRSGHSLIGSLLNAHPDAVISHELNVLTLVRRGYLRAQLFDRILARDRRRARRGGDISRYDYEVPGQWQGRVRVLRVLGDKKGCGTTRLLRRRPGLLTVLETRIQCPVKLIHVVRNPFDNVATMVRREASKGRPATPARSLSGYRRLCETNATVLATAPPGSTCTIRLEDLIADPPAALAELCAFLELGAPPDYLRDCSSIVFSSPRRTRGQIEWAPADVEAVNELIAAHPFLSGYGFDD